ncbi:MAG: diguanylate cyclase [Longimicrobiales bacterium]
MGHADPSTARSSIAERYRVLLDIGHNLARTLSTKRLYRSIYKETARVLEAAGFYVALYDQEKDLATVVFYADQGVERNVAITYRGSDSDVLRLGKGAIVYDRVENRSLMVLGEEGTEVTRSAISAPLIYEGVVVGAISTQSYQPGAYREEDLELLQGIADLAAVAINNAWHVTELDSRRREAERIEEIGRAISSSLDAKEVLRAVIDAVLELLQADASTVWLLEGGNARVAASGGKIRIPEGEVWPIPDPIREAVVRDRSPLLIEDLPNSSFLPASQRKRLQAKSALVVPLILDNEVAGGLSAGKEQPGGIGKEGVDLLLRLASQTSVALVNARLHQSIQALSLTDPLTDLPNRRHMDIHLQREVAAARRGRHVCVVLFDLDDFKAHNDSLGHVVGDQILRRFGRLLLGETRAMNLAARYGGDEFISILTELPREGAELHAHRVVDRVRQDPELARYGVTVSYGIGEFDPATMFEVEDLVRAADAQLHQAKAGRGRDPEAR